MKHFLPKIVLFILCFFTINSVSFGKDIKFVQISDLHHKNDAESVARFDKFINDVNNIKNVDFVVFTGDNINNPNKNDFIRFLKQSKALKFPYYIVVGNHDVSRYSGMSKEEYVRLIKKYDKYQKFDSTNFIIESGGIVFIALDGAKEFIPGQSGYYRQETLEWLDKILTKNKNKKVVIFQHFPLKQRFTARDTYKVEKYQELLKKHSNVIGTFSGHFHMNEEYVEDGIFHSIAGRACYSDASYKIVDMIQEKNSETGKKEYKFYTQVVNIYD